MLVWWKTWLSRSLLVASWKKTSKFEGSCSRDLFFIDWMLRKDSHTNQYYTRKCRVLLCITGITVVHVFLHSVHWYASIYWAHAVKMGHMHHTHIYIYTYIYIYLHHWHHIHAQHIHHIHTLVTLSSFYSKKWRQRPLKAERIQPTSAKSARNVCWSSVGLHHKPQSLIRMFFFWKTENSSTSFSKKNLRLCFDALWSLPPCQLPFEWFLGVEWGWSKLPSRTQRPNCTVQGNAPVRFLVKFQSLGEMGNGGYGYEKGKIWNNIILEMDTWTWCKRKSDWISEVKYVGWRTFSSLILRC